MKHITINWHILQKCNYKCDYCFAKYNKSTNNEIHLSKKKIAIFLTNLHNFFHHKYENHQIKINIAGGEPTLSKNLSFIIEKAFSLGFKVSLITNGSKITRNFIQHNAKYLSIFAMSIDTLDKTTNQQIGREFRGQILKLSTIVKNIEQIRELNANIQIKINTVVNTHNYNEYIGSFIDLLKPNKWKVLQALSLDERVYCSDEEFEIFVENHKNIKVIPYIESNADMKDSYIMIDPYGRFYQNTLGKYNYSDSILDISVAQAFESVEFDISKFNSRYEKKEL